MIEIVPVAADLHRLVGRNGDRVVVVSTVRPPEVTSWPFGVTDKAAPRVYASLPSLACTASQVPLCSARSNGLPVMCCAPAGG